jgi:hypothetical protein
MSKGVKRIHNVNITLLLKNRMKTLDEFNPAESIIDSKDAEQKFEKSVEKIVKKSLKSKKSKK